MTKSKPLVIVWDDLQLFASPRQQKCEGVPGSRCIVCPNLDLCLHEVDNLEGDLYE